MTWPDAVILLGLFGSLAWIVHAITRGRDPIDLRPDPTWTVETRTGVACGRRVEGGWCGAVAIGKSKYGVPYCAEHLSLDDNLGPDPDEPAK